MSPRDSRQRLVDMLEAADRILDRAADSKHAFLADESLQVWVVYHLQVLGEAAAAVSTAITEEHPEVDWIAARSMRNRLVHGYFDLDLDLIWEVVERDLPCLREQIAAIIDDTLP